jgi:hypothetical protein
MLSPRVLRTVSEGAYVSLVLIAVVAAGLSCAAIISQAVRTSPERSWENNFNALVIGASYIVLVSSLLPFMNAPPPPGADGNVKFAVSLSFCVKRRVAVRVKLERISQTYRTIGRDDLPDVRVFLSISMALSIELISRRSRFPHQSVHKYVSQEFIRTCLVVYESLPQNVFHEGWGRPGERHLCVIALRLSIALTTLLHVLTGTKYSGIPFRRALLDTVPHIGVFNNQQGFHIEY